MNITIAIFFVIGIIALVGALGVVASRNVVYSALFLLLSLIMVAGLYILLYADFLAIVQILIYGGAIVIVIFFALMLTRTREMPLRLDNPKKPWAIVASLAAFALLATTTALTHWKILVTTPERVSYQVLGRTLFTQWAVPFEIASILLLVALVGAIVIARPGGRE
ncbi:MAG: NADH-quinone oxidoreductase subunit J [Chloroflexi bacterium]|nr:NADH-quinone oxidoreductase subunit J [Chloroflexota bacterium]